MPPPQASPRAPPAGRARTWADRRVLVTGGLGFLGSNIVHGLAGAGAQVTVLDNLDPRAGGNRYNLDGVPGHVTVDAGDIRDAEALARTLRRQDVVFHCAAISAHAPSLRDPLASLSVIAEGTLRLLESARRVNDRAKIVHVGTTTQIGRTRAQPITEDHPEFPLDLYSANKSVAEKYALIYHKVHGLTTSVVRLGNVYGPRACIRSAEHGFVNFFIGLGLQGKDIPVFGAGDQRRSLTYVDDAVDALVRAAESNAADGQVFQAGAERPQTVQEIAQAIARHVGGRVTNVEWPAERAAIEVGDAVVDSRKIRETLGWTAQTALDVGLGRTADYYRPRLQNYLEVLA